MACSQLSGKLWQRFDNELEGIPAAPQELEVE
jgi:hypothetical protein